VVKLKRLNQALEVKVADRTQELAVANRRLQTANAALEKQSKLDQLTQILNRRGFNAVYEKAWDICQRLQQPLSFIIIDVDNFKTVNDKLGHLTGDQFLEEIALLLQNAAGSSDVEVARLGGDEFVCVLQNAAEEEAAEFAETIRAEIGNLTFTNADWQLELSASLGVASLIPNETSSPKELFALADQALYKAKESGRNKMVKASDI
jgi:diguanylate cyclase (GGDEF)-like protein